ncbi:hypothetical protein [Lysobacter gummosus]|uniref:hypothetical protein n=1 Tax=Lysobacter gummosus TaxID=262324 RepID=UPI003626CA84
MRRGRITAPAAAAGLRRPDRTVPATGRPVVRPGFGPASGSPAPFAALASICT